MGKVTQTGLVVSFIFLLTIILFSGSSGSYDSRNEDIITFSRTFGKSGFYMDKGISVEMTNDGGYLVAGRTDSFGSGRKDIWLIKTDERGNEIWNTTFGGKWTDVANSMERTTDGGYIIVGYAYPETGDIDESTWVIKIDNNGNKQWDYLFREEGYFEDGSIQQTSDEGYIIVCTGEEVDGDGSDAYLIKIDKDGNEQWDRSFGIKVYSQCGRFVRQTHDMGYVILSNKKHFIPGPNYYGEERVDLWLIKTDKDGNELWNKTYGGEKWDAGTMFLQTNDGGYILLGKTKSYSSGEDSDIWLIKTDSEGNRVWEKTFGGNESEAGQSILATQDGGYILTGSGWLIKIDSIGNEEWSRYYKGWADDIKSTPDGGYVLTGDLGGDLWLFKTDSFGRSEGLDELPTPIKSENGGVVDSDEDGSKLYIIIGGSAVVLLLVVICLFVYIRRKRKGGGDEEGDEDEDEEEEDKDEEIENKVKCPECEWDNDPSYVYCMICGTTLKE